MTDNGCYAGPNASGSGSTEDGQAVALPAGNLRRPRRGGIDRGGADVHLALITSSSWQSAAGLRGHRIKPRSRESSQLFNLVLQFSTGRRRAPGDDERG